MPGLDEAMSLLQLLTDASISANLANLSVRPYSVTECSTPGGAFPHRFSRRTFTQHQLPACLVLKDLEGSRRAWNKSLRWSQMSGGRVADG